jgi:dTDP-4-dehydrorhamnose 3,5-epimerase
MIFTATPLPGAWLIDPERWEDHRGFFARMWCQREFEARGLNPRLVQCNISFNKKRGTLRGMHYQAHPWQEDKLVRCTMGAVYDVIIDLRRDSPTFRRHHAVVLSAENRRVLYVPQGFAHGFQTLADNTEVFYQMSEFHAREAVRGVRWNDPAFDIRWPLADPILSDRDRTCPDFVPPGDASR